MLITCIATAFCGGATWAMAGILGFGHPLAIAADMKMARPSIAKVEEPQQDALTIKVNIAHERLLIAPNSRPVVAASFVVDGKTLARQFDLALKGDTKTPDARFDAVQKKAGLNSKKLASLFAKPSPAKSSRIAATEDMPASERFGEKADAGDKAPVMLAYATPGDDASAVTAFSALLSEDADQDDDMAAVPDDNTTPDDDSANVYDDTPSDAPLPQLRPNVQLPLKPMGAAKQVEPQDDEQEQEVAKPAPEPAPKPRSLAYARPDMPNQPERGSLGRSLRDLFGGGGNIKGGGGVAVYDISAAKVYMPDGSVLEAHSGVGKMADNARYVSVKMGGPTPPHTYNLKMRERLFHGVEAIRMLPVDGKNKYGRDGFLTHSYLLRGGRAESHGCVAFKDYNKFLKAFKQGKVRQIVVIPSGGRSTGIRMASNG
ncbi:MAG: DUF2778 domain-containing protein [Mesorhizobium sp.]